MAQYEDSSVPEESVPCPADLPNFATGPSGLTVMDAESSLSVRIDDASAVPPEKDYNNWTIAVLDADGQPLSAARLNWACAWMAAHGHGSNPKAVTDLGGGRYLLQKQNFSMHGPWAVRLWVDPTGTGSEYSPQKGSAIAEGEVCIPTNGTPAQFDIEINFCVPDTRTGT